MQKTLRFSVFLLMTIVSLLSGCQKSELTETATSPKVDNSVKSTNVYTPCGTQLVANLFENGNTAESHGLVTIGNDLVNLYINIELFNNMPIQNTYLYIGTPSGLANLPSSHPGNPQYYNSIDPINGTGHFDLAAFPYIYPPYPVSSSYTKIIPLSSLPECFIIVAFVDIGAPYASYTRVSAKATSTTKSSGYYLEYCKRNCGNSGSETAYAKADDVSTCFLEIPGVTSNNWGWSNGPIAPGTTFSWPIYAGAGQCNIANGTLVGTLNVSYGTDGIAIITYDMGETCHLSETHLYVGNTILYMKNGKKITAPGQFPFKHENLNGVTTDTYTITGLTGNIYIVAHSVVSW